MITGELKSKIDKLWQEFWQGGIANPLTVVEQITFLMFARMIDIKETRNEKLEKRTNTKFKHSFSKDEQHLRWSNLRHIEDADKLLKVVRDEVFPHFRKHAGDGQFGDYMKDAQLMIQKASLLVKAVSMIDALPLDAGDTKGDLYEYLLSKLTTAGINGQFRTPRHIIKLIVQMMDPQVNEKVADPACGTAGFLVSALEHVLETHTSKDGQIVEKVEVEPGKFEQQITYTGDMLSKEEWKHVKNDMFHGFDFDATMLRIAAMNLVMHGADDPDIHYQDTMSQNFPERFPQAANEGFDVILANPPFKGSLDEEDVNPAILRMVKTRKTELLFVALILRMLKSGGRSATIVPDGVLFGSSGAHLQLRQLLVEQNQLEAIISLPSGVFKPYAGVSTAIMIFTKGGKTDHVWFYDVEADGLSLDDKRTAIDANDLPDVLAKWQARDKKQATGKKNDKTAKSFWVSKKDIIENKYDLSINRYREKVHVAEQFDPPKKILKRLLKLEEQIQKELQELEAML
jgi:type I restriction enzyme M protein